MGAFLDQIRSFLRRDDGAVLAETIIVVPFVTIFAAGILEFGNMFWQKEQIEVGLRDAARYIARCQTDAGFNAACGTGAETVRGETNARNIAFYGTASPDVGALLRVPGWGPAAADIIITSSADVVRVEAAHAYVSSPIFGWLGIADVNIQAYHEQRYIGW